MGKMKIKKSITRRIKISSTGKLMRRKGFGRHLKASKSKQQMRGTKKTIVITGPLRRKLQHVLGLR